LRGSLKTFFILDESHSIQAYSTSKIDRQYVSGEDKYQRKDQYRLSSIELLQDKSYTISSIQSINYPPKASKTKEAMEERNRQFEMDNPGWKVNKDKEKKGKQSN